VTCSAESASSSPGAGLTALAFSIGSFALAALAVPLARRYGRVVLFGGGVLMALGALAVRIGASHVDGPTDFWPIVPGLAIALFIATALLSLALPRTALSEAELAEVE
jgi:branched-subunit amino acid ABC-type transport system permease component